MLRPRAAPSSGVDRGAKPLKDPAPWVSSATPAATQTRTTSIARTQGSCMATDPPNGELKDVFEELGKIVLGDEPLAQILERVVHVATRALPAAAEASITLISADNPFTVAFAGERAIALDERQYEAERGPCLDSATSAQLIEIPDMKQETRWQAFTQAATELGVRS